MSLLPRVALLAVLLNLPSSTAGSKITSEQPNIRRSGKDFMQVCANIENEPDNNSLHIYNNATCLGWAEGFRDGFTVHDELLSVPQKDRMICVPREVSTIQIVRVIKKYIADNPEKAHRLTRYNASVALAGAFPCRARK